jgi:hypothetical protein
MAALPLIKFEKKKRINVLCISSLGRPEYYKNAYRGVR